MPRQPLCKCIISYISNKIFSVAKMNILKYLQDVGNKVFWVLIELVVGAVPGDTGVALVTVSDDGTCNICNKIN